MINAYVLRRLLFLIGSNPLSRTTVFRGNFKGDNIGPFVCQFLLKGNKDEVLGNEETDGFVKFGAAKYDQKIVVGLKDKDYMTHYDSWLSVQNGEDRNVLLMVTEGLKEHLAISDEKSIGESNTYPHLDTDSDYNCLV